MQISSPLKVLCLFLSPRGFANKSQMACCSLHSAAKQTTSSLRKWPDWVFLRSPSISARKFPRHGKSSILANRRNANDCFQGYFMVAHPVASTMGFRGYSGPRWPGFSSSLPGNATRVCEWDVPVCGHGLQEIGW